MPGGNATPAPERQRDPPAGNSPSVIHISSFTAVLVEQVNQARCWEQVPAGERSCSASPQSPGDIPRHGTVEHRGASPP